MKIIAVIERPAVVRQILDHLGLPKQIKQGRLPRGLRQIHRGTSKPLTTGTPVFQRSGSSRRSWCLWSPLLPLPISLCTHVPSRKRQRGQRGPACLVTIVHPHLGHIHGVAGTQAHGVGRSLLTLILTLRRPISVP